MAVVLLHWRPGFRCWGKVFSVYPLPGARPGCRWLLADGAVVLLFMHKNYLTFQPADGYIEIYDSTYFIALITLVSSTVVELNKYVYSRKFLSQRINIRYFY